MKKEGERFSFTFLCIWLGDSIQGKHRFDEGIRFVGEDRICGGK